MCQDALIQTRVEPVAAAHEKLKEDDTEPDRMGSHANERSS